MPSSTLPSWVLECLCPGVRTTESGLPLPSQARWTLVERPPRLLPSASSNEWPSPFLDLCDSALCVLPQRAGEPARPCRPRSPPTRPRPPRPIWSGRGQAADPKCHPSCSARSGRSRSARDRSRRASPSTVLRYVASKGCRLRLCGALAPLTATSAVIGKERGDLLPGFVGDLSAPDHTHSSSSRALYELQKLSWIFVFIRQTLVAPARSVRPACYKGGQKATRCAASIYSSA